MCGIAGIFDPEGARPVDRQVLERMTRSLAHRGPDGEGFHLEDGVGLGHRRLSIIDLDGGAQPLFNEDGTVVVTYNGEIYNHRAVAEQLRARGHTFRTRCDTEVIVHAWEEWGPACVERLDGMFAFGLYDAGTRTLFLARDRFGIKPLYYTELADGRMAFASELKALMVLPELSREIDPEAVEDFFAFGYVPDPRSIYASVRKLAPGHTLEIASGRRRLRRYWQWAVTEGADESSAVLEEQLIAHLKRSCEARMMAEVPLGAFLSGGVDSSAVVACMAEARTRPVQTCSIRFHDQAFDESSYAAMVARRYGTNHHVDLVDFDAVHLAERLAHVYDEPFADSSSMPTYLVCEMARKHVTVVLSGDGGDEVFGGYQRYRSAHYHGRFRSLFPFGLNRAVFGGLLRAYPRMDAAPRHRRLHPHLAAAASDEAHGYARLVCVGREELRMPLYSRELRAALGGHQAVDVMRRAMPPPDGLSYLSRVQRADLETYLCGDILTKVDRASMAHGLEVRVPFLDHHLVEWAGRLRRRQRLRRSQGKALLKRALEPKLPREVLYRSKQGFGVPLDEWLAGPMRERVRALASSRCLRESGFFDMDSIGALSTRHLDRKVRAAQLLWSLMMFEAFLSSVHTNVRNRAT